MIGGHVRVYFNLHARTFSVQQRGLVVAHVDEFHLIDARFIVQPAGHARVLREGRKNVHAFVDGYWAEGGGPPCCHPVRYDPYVAPYFVDGHGLPILRAAHVRGAVVCGSPILFRG